MRWVPGQAPGVLLQPLGRCRPGGIRFAAVHGHWLRRSAGAAGAARSSQPRGARPGSRKHLAVQVIPRCNQTTALGGESCVERSAARTLGAVAPAACGRPRQQHKQDSRCRAAGADSTFPTCPGALPRLNPPVWAAGGLGIWVGSAPGPGTPRRAGRACRGCRPAALAPPLPPARLSPCPPLLSHPLPLLTLPSLCRSFP